MTESPKHGALDAQNMPKGLHVPHSREELAEDVAVLMQNAQSHLPEKLRGHSRWWWLAHVMIIPVLVVMLLTIWLGTGVRNVDAIKPFLIHELDGQTSPYHAQVRTLQMYLDTKKWHLIADLKQLEVSTDSGHKVVQFPAIRLTLKWTALLAGHIKVKELGILSPSLTLQRDASGALSLNIAAQTEAIATQTSSLSTSSPLHVSEILMGIRSLGLDRVGLYNGSIAMGAGAGRVLWHTPSAVVSFKGEDERNLRIGYDITLSDNTQEARLSGVAAMNQADKSLNVEAQLANFPLYTLAPLHERLKVFEAVKVHLTGKASLIIEASGAVRQLEFDISKGGGLIQDAHFFPDAVTLNQVHIKGSAQQDFSHLTIDDMAIKLGEGASLKGHALIDWMPATAQAPTSLAVKAQAEAYRVNVADIKRYWPAPLAPMSRTWVMENLQAGIIPRGEIVIDIKPEDTRSLPLPDHYLKAAVQVEGAKVRYLPNMPEVTDVSGMVYFTGRSMRVEAQTGKSLSASVLHKAAVEIPDFFDEAHGIPMTVDIDADSVAADVAEVMSKERLNLGASLNLNPKMAKGMAKGTISLKFPMFSHVVPAGEPVVVYQIKAQMEKVSQNKVLDKWDINGLKGTFEANNAQLKLVGLMNLNGLDVDLTITDSYGVNPATRYQLKGQIPVTKLDMFGVKEIPHVSGILGVDADIFEKKGQSPLSKVSLDLTQAELEIPIMLWKKPAGIEASGKLVHQSIKPFEMISDFQLKSSGLYMQGDMQIDGDTKEISTLHLKELRYGRTDVALDYAVNKQGIRTVAMRGANADATPWIGEEDEESLGTGKQQADKKPTPSVPQEDAISKLVNMDVDVQVARLQTGRERAFQPFKAQLNCRNICSYVDVHGKTKSGNDFDWQVRSTGAARSLRGGSNNAGEVFHILGITKHMRRGQLTVEGRFDDAEANHPLKGTLLVQDFTVVNGPILTRLLSLMSLTGMVNMLSGSGIEFKKAQSDFGYTADALVLSNTRAHGSAIGLTVSGKISPFAGVMALEGTLVPAYSANSILGNIPVLGTLLTGGEGGGIIAANFSIKGNTGDPSVMVNPLSLLTPGFLRKIFDIAD